MSETVVALTGESGLLTPAGEACWPPRAALYWGASAALIGFRQGFLPRPDGALVGDSKGRNCESRANYQ